MHPLIPTIVPSFCLSCVLPLAAQSTLVVTRSLRFEPGAELPRNIVIAADNVVIDGGGAELVGPARPGAPNSGTGVGIRCRGHSGVVLRNLKVRGFRIGLEVIGGHGWRIEDCDFSGNYHDPDYGWGDGERVGGMVLTGCRGFRIHRTKARHNWNGLDLWGCTDGRVEDCDLSHCSNVCLKLWRSSRNLVQRNDLSYGLRIRPGEVHARDSTCVLLETGSDDNRFVRNDITHGGDGVFIRVLNGWVSKGNVFIENDCSHANNNGFESWSPGNTYLRNKSNHCSYGFWLGGSDHTVLIGNEASYNGLPGGFHNAPESDFRHGGIVIVHGSGTHTLIEGNTCVGNNGGGIVFRGDLATRGAKWRMRHLVVQRNVLKDNQWGLFARFVDGLYLSSNEFAGNRQDELLEDVRDLVRFGPAAPTAQRPRVVLRGPARAVVGQPVTFDATGSRVSGPGPATFEWDVAGARRTGIRVEHRFVRVGMHRVGLTVRADGLAQLAFRDVYVVAASEHPATEAATCAGRRATQEGGGPVRLDCDGDALVGRTALRLRPEPYGGGDVEWSLTPPAGGVWDLSGVDRIEFWVRFRNPNRGGFQGPNPILHLHAAGGEDQGRPFWRFTPVYDGAPRNLFGDLPYSEARDGWLALSIPLAGDARWQRSLAFAGRRPPFVSGRLEFTTVTTAVRSGSAAALTTDGRELFCAVDPGGRVYRSRDGVAWRPLPPLRRDLGVDPQWINGMLTHAGGVGEAGALLLTAPARRDHDHGHGNRQLVAYDLATGRWRFLPTVTAMTHGATLVGNHLFGLAHAVAGNYGGPLCRVDLGAAAVFDDHSVLGGLRGAEPHWLSRAAQLATVAGKVYGIKNDWQTPAPATGRGDRLFVFDPRDYRPSAFGGGGRWDAGQWQAADTRCRDLGALPFEVGHGACLVGLPPGFGGLVGEQGGLFVVAGCSPSNHEGHGTPSDHWAVYDIATAGFQVGRLPGPTGAGTSACRFGERLIVKRGGLRSAVADREVWSVVPLPAAEAARRRARQVPVAVDPARIARLGLHLDSSGAEPFTVWIDGLRLVPRR